MQRPTVLFQLCLCALAVVGCEGPRSTKQRLEGEWQGRPEKSAERVLREWPRPAGGAPVADPDAERRAAASLPTDLEGYGVERVGLTLRGDGVAKLSLDQQPGLEGRWRMVMSEGRRAVVEIAVEPAVNSEERRRFAIEFLPGEERFTLREEGADLRFGRLIFERPGENKSPDS